MAWQNGQWNQPMGIGQGQMYPQQNQFRQPNQQSSMDWIRVPNVGDVEQVSVMPGQTAWVMAQNANVFAVRSADQMGITSTRYFQFSEFDPRQADLQKQASFEERLSRLEAMVNGTQSTTGRFESTAGAGKQSDGNAV